MNKNPWKLLGLIPPLMAVVVLIGCIHRSLKKTDFRQMDSRRICVALTAKDGDIFNAGFFVKLKSLTDDLFYMPEIDRTRVQSLVTPDVRYAEAVEDGWIGGPVIPENFSPTQRGFSEVQRNLRKSAYLGQLVSEDFTAAMVRAEIQPDALSDPRDVSVIFQSLRKKYEDSSTSLHWVQPRFLVIQVVVQPDGCTDPAVMETLEKLHWRLAQDPSVESVVSLAGAAKRMNAFLHEGQPKWQVIPRNRLMLMHAISGFEPKSGLLNSDGSQMPMFVFLKDHSPEIEFRIAQEVQAFRAAAAKKGIFFQMMEEKKT